MAAGKKIAASEDVFCSEHGDDFIAREARGSFVDFGNDVLEIRALGFVVGQECDARHGRELAPIRS